MWTPCWPNERRYGILKDRITGDALREMLLCAYEALEREKQAINELNVFPVPDGDTGTNMTLTVASAAAELRKLTGDEGIALVSDRAASAMLRGARGNSGVILSLLFRGVARALKGRDESDAKGFAAALRAGVDAAYKAVMKPAEGTILTVSRVATEAAVALAETETDIELVLTYALAAGRDALAETTGQNPVLARAGVIDAGGMGYVTMLEAFLASLQGKVRSGSLAAPAEEDAEEERRAFGEFSTEEITFAYDTVYTMRKLVPERNLDLLRAYLDSIGDSLVISEDDEIFKVHVHTNTPGEALTESAKYGVLELAKIENMRSQHEALVSGGERVTADDVEERQAPAAAAPPRAQARKPCGFVAVCAGAGLERLFADLGCDRVVTGGQTMNPSTADILDAIEGTPAETVFVFPNNKNIIMAAEQCVPLTEKRVVVIPTKTVPEGITALLNLDAEAEPEALREVFAGAISGVHTAQVTYAVRDSDFDGTKIRAGEYLCLLDGALLGSYARTGAMEKQLSKAVRKLKPELVTVYYGENVKEEQARRLSDLLAEELPDADVTLVNGGQPVYYYLISVE